MKCWGFPPERAPRLLANSMTSRAVSCPAAFCAALLNAQPMGFWSPHSLCQDARRHGVVMHSPDLNTSNAHATLEPCAESVGGVAVRLGLSSIRGLGLPLAQSIEALRKGCRAATSGCESGGLTQSGDAEVVREAPYTSLEDLVRRVPELNLAQLEAMATAGVFERSLGLERREALWAVGAAVQARPGRLEGIVVGEQAPRLPGMEPMEVTVADLWATGVSPTGHPTQYLREALTKQGVVTSADLWECEPRSKVTVAGVVRRCTAAKSLAATRPQLKACLLKSICTPFNSIARINAASDKGTQPFCHE